MKTLLHIDGSFLLVFNFLWNSAAENVDIIVRQAAFYTSHYGIDIIIDILHDIIQ